MAIKFDRWGIFTRRFGDYTGGDDTGTDVGTADISATFRVTWTWPGYGPSSGTSCTPKGMLTGSASTTPKGGALSSVIHSPFVSMANTDKDGNPYTTNPFGIAEEIRYGLFTYVTDITATAIVSQNGPAVPTDIARILPYWTGKKSRICKVVNPKHYDAGGTHAESEVSFQ